MIHVVSTFPIGMYSIAKRLRPVGLALLCTTINRVAFLTTGYRPARDNGKIVKSAFTNHRAILSLFRYTNLIMKSKVQNMMDYMMQIKPLLTPPQVLNLSCLEIN